MDEQAVTAGTKPKSSKAKKPQKDAESKDMGRALNPDGTLSTLPDPDEHTIDSVKGLMIKLGDAEVFWRLPSGSLELSRLKKDMLCTRVPKDIPDEDALAIVSALRCGTVIETDAEESYDPPERAVIPFDLSIKAYRLLDTKPVSMFGDLVQHTHSIALLDACLVIEKADRQRKDYVDILTNKLKELGR